VAVVKLGSRLGDAVGGITLFGFNEAGFGMFSSFIVLLVSPA
jgi:hypothetical protein